MKKVIIGSLGIILLYSIIAGIADRNIKNLHWNYVYGIDYNTDIAYKINELKRKTLIILSNHYEITDTKLKNIDSIITSVYVNSIRFNIDPELILSMMYTESRFNQYCKSWAGAMGLMQIMPQYVPYPRSHIWNIETNIYLGVEEISRHINNKDSIVKALYRYNGAHIKNYNKTTKISKESYYYAIRVMDIYYEYKNLEK